MALQGGCAQPKFHVGTQMTLRDLKGEKCEGKKAVFVVGLIVTLHGLFGVIKTAVW